jgi:hypothetical protein
MMRTAAKLRRKEKIDCPTCGEPINPGGRVPSNTEKP